MKNCRVVTRILIPSAMMVYFLNAEAKASPPSESEVDQLVNQLTNDDLALAKGANKKLRELGEDVVPELFARLITANWDLKPRLLEVLIDHGRGLTAQKLLSGTETERIYAGLVYELTRAGEHDDYDTPEFKAMVEVLLKAIKSEDKYLRAAAGLALTYDERSTVFFEHFHEIVPALISSFDTDLVVERPVHCGDPSDVLFVGIGLRLDAMIGDRLAYFEIERKLWSEAKDVGSDSDTVRRSMSKLIPLWRPQIDELRTYWQSWWDNHKNATTLEIARIIIERNISLLEANNRALVHDPLIVISFLDLWTGEFFLNGSDARQWWTDHKDTYQGPRHPGQFKQDD